MRESERKHDTDTVSNETPRSTAERQRRMEALTRVARTVSHDYNNLLVAIQSNLNSLREKLSSTADETVLTSLEQLDEAATLAHDLTRQLQAFTVSGAAVLEPRSLSFVVNTMESTLSAGCSGTTTLTFDLDADIPACPLSEPLVETALLNIVTNACESLAGTPGMVQVKTTIRDGCDIAPDDVFLLENLHATGYACLEVSNDGPPVTPDQREHLFDPCFSTRMRAAGLGLSAVMGTMRTHRGCIEVPLLTDGFALRLLFPVR